jgi:hypothetical protein
MPAVPPTPVVVRPPAAPAASETEALPLPEVRRALHESVRLDLYAANPCRTLGLFPAVEASVLVERVQAMLGPALAPAWAFAPELPLSAEQLRRAGQAADSPPDRLLAELFWFWPASYPDNRSDEALAALAAGDAEKAYACWLAAAGQGYAAHNMAVMFHYAALGRELERGPLDEEARAWWTAAAEQWTVTLAADDFWTHWTTRWAQAGEATTPAEGAKFVRTELPSLLGSLSLLAAVERARHGELAEARWLREFAVRRLADPSVFARTLSVALEAELKRAEDAVDEAEERLTADDQPCLRHVAEMLHQLAARRRVIETVAGPDSSALGRLGTQVVEVSLAGLAEHARRTKDEAAVLPWLLHLSGWPAAAEQRRRVATTCRETWARLIAAGLAAGAGAPASRHEAVLRICTETLVPAVAQFAWDERVQVAYRQRVVQRLRELAREAWLELGEFEVTAQACVLAAELLDEDASSLVVRERRQLWQQFQRAQSGALILEHDGTRLEIDSRKLVFGGREMPVEALTGLRYGVAQGLGGFGPRVAWYAGRDSVVLDAASWFDTSTGGSQRYRQIVEALEACVVPALTARIVERVKAGQSVVLGQSALRPEGLVFRRRPGQPDQEEPVPYTRLTQRVATGELIIGRTDDPAAELHYSLPEVWNAVAMAEVLARLGEADAEVA